MVDSTQLSDKGKRDFQLVQSALEGNQMAYTELMGMYRETIFHMMLKMAKNTDDAEDLTIEAFGKAFSRLEQYSPSFAFSTWLFKIASNNCIDFIRKKRLHMTSMDTGRATEDGRIIYLDAQADGLNPEQSIEQDQRIKHMRDIVSRLKPRYRELIEKRYFEELSYEEIADELNLPLGTVKAQLFRARDFLASMMENSKDQI